MEKLTNNIVPIKSYTLSSSSNVHSIFTTPVWIKIAQNHSLPPSSSISTTMSPFIPVATANQFSCFNGDNEDEAYADSGATITIVKDNVKLNNEIKLLMV